MHSNVLIEGAYGSGNFGDDALMVAVSKVAKELFPASTIHYLSLNASYVYRLLAEPRVVTPFNRHEIVVDTLLYGGGTQFYAFSGTSEGLLCRVLRNARRPVRLACKLIQRAIDKANSAPSPSMAAIGIGLGPFSVRHKERQTRLLVSRMEYVAVRDTASYALCRRWGCENVCLRSDVCYLPGLWNASVFRRTQGPATGITRVGVIPRDWPHTAEGDSYSSKLFEVVDELRRSGKDVDFISFAPTYDHEWRKRLLERHERIIAWNAECGDISSFLNVLSGYDAFITARYHGAVFASILGKPVVCIGIEQKLELVASLLSAGARLWAYPFDVSSCLAHMADLDANYSRSVDALAGIVKQQAELAQRMVHEYAEICARSPAESLL